MVPHDFGILEQGSVRVVKTTCLWDPARMIVFFMFIEECLLFEKSCISACRNIATDWNKVVVLYMLLEFDFGVRSLGASRFPGTACLCAVQGYACLEDS